MLSDKYIVPVSRAAAFSIVTIVALCLYAILTL